MTSKTLWPVIIKLAGLYTLWQFIELTPGYINMFISWYSPVEYEQQNVALWVFPLQGIVTLLIAILCLFKTRVLIKVLRLDNDGEAEVLHLNIHRSQLLKIVVIVLGGLMFLDGIPVLSSNFLKFFQVNKDVPFFKDPTFSWLVFAILKVTIGYCMVAYNRWFVNFIELRRKAN